MMVVAVPVPVGASPPNMVNAPPVATAFVFPALMANTPG